MAHEADRPVAVGNHALAETRVRYLSKIALRGRQHAQPFGDENFRRERHMAGPLKTYKFGDVLEILAENVLPAGCEHGHGARTELGEFFLPERIVQNVAAREADASLRKKLLRSHATASARLGIQNESIGGLAHSKRNVNHTAYHRSNHRGWQSSRQTRTFAT